eukprot:2396389-Prorocentrum_lima.AAC.1
MTSSLVGSEMCIRDSLGARRAPDPILFASQLHMLVAPITAATGWVCMPVSYTHLTLPTICSV